MKNKNKIGNVSKYIDAMCIQYNINQLEARAFLFSNFPELQNREKCSNCHASMKMFWQVLSPGLVGCLIKAIEFVKKNKNSFHLQYDLNLSKTEYNNMQKLRYHGLIAHDEGKIGYWLITRRGGQFLRNEIDIPDGVLTFRNHIEGYSEKRVRITHFKNKFPYFESEFAFEYKKQEDLFN